MYGGSAASGCGVGKASGRHPPFRTAGPLGFKMVKWLRAIEFVEDYLDIRGGEGSSRQDITHYEQAILI